MNIGRQVADLALTYLPDYLLHMYCNDIGAGKTHAQGSVYAFYSNWYTLTDLDNLNLWARMDSKIASYGGCGNIP